MSTQLDVFKQVLISLRQILHAMDLQSKQLARDTGLTTAQLIALQLIDQAGTLSAGQLAQALNLSQATVTAVITRLEALGLISRTRDEQDKRRVVLAVAAAGQRLLDEAPRTLQKLLEQRFGELEQWEQLQILVVVQRLAALLDAQRFDAAPVLDFGALNEAAPP